jgi:hypothetical protein
MIKNESTGNRYIIYKNITKFINKFLNVLKTVRMLGTFNNVERHNGNVHGVYD